LAHEPGVVTVFEVSETVPEQLSVAVGVIHCGVAEHSIVVAEGSAEISGGVVSSTLMIWEAEAMLPQASVATQVRVSLYCPAQFPGVVVIVEVSVTVPRQLSVAVGVTQFGVSEHWITVAPGSAEITGTVVSITLITCEAVATLPHESVAVHVRVCVKLFAQEPGVVTVLDVSVTWPPQLSVTVGVIQLHVSEHWIVVAPGRAEITGGVVSRMVMVCVAVVVPHADTKVKVRVTTIGQVPLAASTYDKV
jgi:hypothetical protein